MLLILFWADFTSCHCIMGTIAGKNGTQVQMGNYLFDCQCFTGVHIDAGVHRRSKLTLTFKTRKKLEGKSLAHMNGIVI